MNTPTLQRVQEIVADVLNVSHATITPQTGPDNLAGWDSVQHVNLILALEQAFDVHFQLEEIEQMLSVEKITAIIQARIQEQP
jgi:acyl carrier protein